MKTNALMKWREFLIYATVVGDASVYVDHFLRFLILLMREKQVDDTQPELIKQDSDESCDFLSDNLS